MTPSETTGNFFSTNGAAIFYRHRPAADERARLVLVHGLGEHSGRYAHVMDFLNEKGVTVTAMDHQGHGQSGGRRGHIDRFDLYLEDLKQMLAITKNNLPSGMKCLLLGHSLGGLAVLRFAQRHPDAADGLIISSPALAPAIKIPLIKGGAAKVLSSLLPTLTLDNELAPDHLSHDPEVVKAYVEDPLVHRRISTRWFTEFLAAMKLTASNADAIQAPVLMQVAGADRLVDPQASKTFFQSLTIRDKALFVYEKLYHEIYNETAEARSQVMADLGQWLDKHLG